MTTITETCEQTCMQKCSKRNYPVTIPYGWYFVAYSSELQAGEVKTIHCFGDEWVLFRNQQGTVGILEPYCPHLGAHLGIGGNVDGELLRCPFHAWGFDPEGYCRNVPYAKKMPPVLEKGPILQGLPVKELNGIIWAWYHPEQQTPLWEAENLLASSSKGWTDFENFEFEVETNVQDILENSVDYAHLKYVHGHTSTFNGDVQFEDIYRTMRLSTEVQVENSHGQKVSCEYSIDIHQKGPGQKVVRYHRRVELCMLFLVTPISSEKTILRFAFTHQKYPEGSEEYKWVKDLLLEKVQTHGDLTGVSADIPIWNHKIYRKKPLLCDGDGPIMQFRSWFKQFYIDS